MTNKEIFEKALCKVKGYRYGCIIFPEVLENKRYYSTIFDIGFAKAFWGESICNMEEVSMYNFPRFETEDPNGAHWIPVRWQFHLARMALEKEPLKYLEKWIKD